MGSEHKFSHVYDKYGLSYRLRNSGAGTLSRREVEGQNIDLEERISRLVEEFMERCPG